MRFGAISDLHTDLYQGGSQGYIEGLCEIIQQRKLDVLLIAGDISEDCGLTMAFVDELNRQCGHRAFYVPGNHDLWSKKNERKTQDIMKTFREDESCLLGKSRVFGETAIVGHVGWYDYRYACGELFSQEQLASKILDGVAWQDSLYVNFARPDTEVCEAFAEEINREIQGASAKKIILMTHMISHPYFLVPLYYGYKWNFFNGFLGSPKLYELTKSPGVCAAVCGHVHFRNSFTENGVHYICACMGYEKEWPLWGGADLSLRRQLDDALVDFEL